jgi:hypothetical protein
MKIYFLRDNDVVTFGMVVNYRVIGSSNVCGRVVGMQGSYTRYMTSFPYGNWQVIFLEVISFFFERKSTLIQVRLKLLLLLF